MVVVEDESLEIGEVSQSGWKAPQPIVARIEVHQVDQVAQFWRKTLEMVVFDHQSGDVRQVAQVSGEIFHRAWKT